MFEWLFGLFGTSKTPRKRWFKVKTRNIEIDVGSEPAEVNDTAKALSNEAQRAALEFLDEPSEDDDPS